MELTRRAFLRSAGAVGLLAAGGCTVGLTPDDRFSAQTSSTTTTVPHTTTTTRATTTTTAGLAEGPTRIRAVAPNASIPNLDPIKWAEPAIQRLYRPVVESLFSWTTDGAISPDLAAEPWATTRDRLVYTVRLRDDVVFHDGSALSAEAVVASFRAAMDPANASQWSPRLGVALESVEAAGPMVVNFRLSRPFSPFETLLAMIPIVPATTAYRPQETYARELIGTGPFTLETWEESGTLRYRRFDGFRGDPGGITELEIGFADPPTAGELLAEGDAQLVMGVGTSWSGGGNVVRAEGSIVRYRALANLDPGRPTSSIGLRRALALEIDRDDLVANALSGHGVASYSTVSPNTDFALDAQTVRAATADAPADTDLPTAGAPLRVLAADDPTVRTMAEGIRAALARLGYESALEVVAGDALAETLRLGSPEEFGDFDLYVAESFAQPLTGFTPDYAYFELRSGLVTNVTKVSDPELDLLLEAATAAPPEERAFRWGAVQRHDAAAVLAEIPLAEGRYAEAVPAGNSSYEPSPMGLLDNLGDL